MLGTTAVTWIMLVFGAATCLPLFFAQLTILIRPQGQMAKDVLIGKGEDWRDRTHFRSAYGSAWGDWLVTAPLLAMGSTGVVLGRPWGYALYIGAAGVQVFINTVLWFQEREYVYPAQGPLVYYTYYWGNFMYWGGFSLVYCTLRLAGVEF